MASSFGLMNESEESNLIQITNTETIQHKKVEDRILEQLDNTVTQSEMEGTLPQGVA